MRVHAAVRVYTVVVDRETGVRHTYWWIDHGPGHHSPISQQSWAAPDCLSGALCVIDRSGEDANCMVCLAQLGMATRSHL